MVWFGFVKADGSVRVKGLGQQSSVSVGRGVIIGLFSGKQEPYLNVGYLPQGNPFHPSVSTIKNGYIFIIYDKNRFVK
jgi:hypothetical protein